MQPNPAADLPASSTSNDASRLSPNVYIWVVLGLAVTAQTAGSVVSQGVYTLVPFWKETFGLSSAQASLAVTVMNSGQVLSMIGLGRAIDRYGERSIVSMTMIGMGLTAWAATVFVSTYWMLLSFLGVLGMFYASVQPGGTRAILRWFPPQHRGLATGFRQAAVPFGTSIAAFMLPVLAASRGWQAAVMMQGLIGIAGGVFFWLFYREDEGELSVGRKVARQPLTELIRTLGQDRAFWPVLLAGVSMCAFQFTFTASAIPFMADHFHLSLVVSAALFAATQVIGIPGRVLLPFICDHFWPGCRERSLGSVMAICTFATLVYVLLPVSAPHWMLYTILGVLGFFGIGWFPLYILQIAEIAPKNAIASTVSFATTMTMIAMALIPFIFGGIVDLAGYTIAWSLLILPVALLVPWLLRLPARRV